MSLKFLFSLGNPSAPFRAINYKKHSSEYLLSISGYPIRIDRRLQFAMHKSMTINLATLKKLDLVYFVRVFQAAGSTEPVTATANGTSFCRPSSSGTYQVLLGHSPVDAVAHVPFDE